MIFYGEISKGVLCLNKGGQVTEWIKSQPDMRVQVEIKKYHPDKTHDQLKYYFGVVVKIAAKEFGYTKEEMDGIFCTMFLRWHTSDGTMYVKSKSELTTKEMGEFIDTCIRHLALQGIVIPPAAGRIADERPDKKN